MLEGRLDGCLDGSGSYVETKLLVCDSVSTARYQV